MIKKYNEFITEEFRDILKIVDLVDVLVRLGYEKDVMHQLLLQEYREGGDEAVAKTFSELTKLETEIVSKGKYGI